MKSDVNDMIDMKFVSSVASVLGYALTACQAGAVPPEWRGLEAAPPELQALCRRIALQLYVDLDAHMLLDVAFEKFEAKRALEVQAAA